MNEKTRAVIQSTFEASNKGDIHFGEVIGQLLSVEVESYLVDYRSGRSTYYVPDGSTVGFDFEQPRQGIAEAFDGDAVRSAIRGAQQGQVMYPQFKELTQRSGCIGYMVWIAGRHVTYFGRRGETHIEPFPK